MRDDTALSINDIGNASIADFGVLYDIPHWCEIELDDAHASVASRTGQPQGHVRLRLGTHIDRPVVDFLDHRLSEFRFLGVVCAAANRVHGQTRYLKVFLAMGIE